MKVAIIGAGGIGRIVAAALTEDAGIQLVALAVRPGAAPAAATIPAVTDARALLATAPDLVVECASHAALRAYAEPVLSAGLPLVALSVGALADPAFREGVLAATMRGGGSLEIPAGAIGGIDALAAARIAGLTRVVYATRKPPGTWRGTAAEDMLALDGVREPSLFFRADAQRAAQLFESKANVCATLALAGVGFERTEVEFWADPQVTCSTHHVTAEGRCGSMRFELANAVADDGKASLLTAMSVVRAVRNRSAALVL